MDLEWMSMEEFILYSGIGFTTLVFSCRKSVTSSLRGMACPAVMLDWKSLDILGYLFFQHVKAFFDHHLKKLEAGK